MAKKAESRDIPRGVLLVAILALALLIATVIATLHAAVTGNEDVIDSFTMLSSQDIWVVGIMTGIFTVIFFSMFLGLLYLRGWGRVLVMVFGMLGLVVYLLKTIINVSTLAGQIDEGADIIASDIVVLVSSVGTVVLLVIILRHLSRPKVILAFEAQEVMLIKRKISAIERQIHLGKQRCNAGEMSKAELAKLKAECLAKEKVLRGQIRHLGKVRLSRERKQKEAEDTVVKRWEEKQAKKEEKKAEKEERKAEKELEKEEKGEEGEEGSAKTKDRTQRNEAKKKS
jgi:hypothetical protein